MADIHQFEVKYDSDGMRSMADELDRLADRLDGADATIPERVDAGVFAPIVADHVNESIASVVALMLRLRAAASLLRATADAKDATERDNERDADGIGDGYGEVAAR